MKLTLLFLLFQTTTVYAEKNWIPLTPLNETKTPKSTPSFDLNLSQIEPINKIIKNATVVKQLFDAVNKKEVPTTNDKNWFALKIEDNK